MAKLLLAGMAIAYLLRSYWYGIIISKVTG